MVQLVALFTSEFGIMCQPFFTSEFGIMCQPFYP